MNSLFKQQLIAWVVAGGLLVFFPDPNQTAEIRAVTGLPAKVSKARIMRLKSQQVARPKTKLNDQEDVAAPTADPYLEDTLE